MKRYIVFMTAMLLGLASCTKPFELQLPLAVNNERLDLLSNEAGYCYIPIYSTGAWTIHFEQAPADTTAADAPAKVTKADSDVWHHTDVTSGVKYRNVHFTYDANATGAERRILFVVEGEGERCEIVIVQPE